MTTSTIRINEQFLSLQGEGRFTGKPSYFIRVFGCNLRCPGFGRPIEECATPNSEVWAIIERIDQFRDKKDLPIPETGCDSYPASYPQFKRFATEFDADSLVETIKQSVGDDPSGVDLVITGGEPLLKGTQIKLASILSARHDYFGGFDSITFETNGTQSVDRSMIEYLANKFNGPVVFSVSPKLACSGEPHDKTTVKSAIDSIKDAVAQIRAARMSKYPRTSRLAYDIANTEVYLKFVVTNQDDVEQVKQYASEVGFINRVDGDIYLMPCGGTYDQHNRNAKVVADLAIEHRMKLCYRVHCAVWRNDWSR